MVISIESDLETAISDAARKLGQSPETIAINALRERFLATVAPIRPRDEWERLLLAVGTDCGLALSNEALSSEGIYD